ncbi:transposase [Streptomyces sp. NPDC060232]|uniref:transposase n=1 Tax=Streptomyces sp. NPDC060232 TaxID=3347079 RepID=UPI00364CE5D1
MPADFPSWGQVYAFVRRWREHGLITEFHDRLRGKVREREGREAEPTAGIIDAQSVRAAATVPPPSRGYDGGKKVPGRKRHIVTDCLGLLLVVAVTAANIGDRDAATGLLTRLRRLHRDITLVWADGGYTGGLIDWCRQKLTLTLEIVKRTDDMTGFVVLPRRWVAGRRSCWRAYCARTVWRLLSSCPWVPRAGWWRGGLQWLAAWCVRRWGRVLAVSGSSFLLSSVSALVPCVAWWRVAGGSMMRALARGGSKGRLHAWCRFRVVCSVFRAWPPVWGAGCDVVGARGCGGVRGAAETGRGWGWAGVVCRHRPRAMAMRVISAVVLMLSLARMRRR